MGPRPDHQAFALPRALRSAPSQCDVVDLFVEHNDDLKITRHLSPTAHPTRVALCEDFMSPAWESPIWTEPSERDVTPLVFKRITEIIKRLTETASPVERRRCLSHAFIAGCVKLLMVNENIASAPWEFFYPPRPKRLEREAEHDAKMRCYEIEKERATQ